MNSEDVFQLVRSGSLFCSLSPSAARDIHILRRYLVVDNPNTYKELTIQDDQSVARGQALDSVVATIKDALKYPRVEHYRWDTDDTSKTAAEGIIFSTEEDPFYQRGCVLYTVPRRIDYRFHDLALSTPEETQSLKDTHPTFIHRATGLALQSLAVFRKQLHRGVRHRASVQVMSLPNLAASSPPRSERMGSASSPNTSAAVAGGETPDPTPSRQSTRGAESAGGASSGWRMQSELRETNMSPSKILAQEYFDNKAFTPHCCFGIFCPMLPEEPQINVSLQHRAPFTSRRWLGLYWSDGTSVPTLGLIGSVTTGGVMRAVPVKGKRTISVGDVLTIEVRPIDDEVRDGTAGYVLFFINNEEVARVPMSMTMPVATQLEDCYFAVRLSEGASVGTFVHNDD